MESLEVGCIKYHVKSQSLEERWIEFLKFCVSPKLCSPVGGSRVEQWLHFQGPAGMVQINLRPCARLFPGVA